MGNGINSRIMSQFFICFQFFLTLGVAAGGISEFDDDLYSGQTPKPWKNRARKASLHFWEHISSWQSTWRKPALIIDYVKVRAL